ncbi:MAG: hypothetical protein JRJ21_05675 [Deltaproteobacteria bacterium]|nr:hypothetical protein [Deltaproteobacteria bacterium]
MSRKKFRKKNYLEILWAGLSAIYGFGVTGLNYMLHEMAGSSQNKRRFAWDFMFDIAAKRHPSSAVACYGGWTKYAKIKISNIKWLQALKIDIRNSGCLDAQNIVQSRWHKLKAKSPPFIKGGRGGFNATA